MKLLRTILGWLRLMLEGVLLAVFFLFVGVFGQILSWVLQFWWIFVSTPSEDCSPVQEGRKQGEGHGSC